MISSTKEDYIRAISYSMEKNGRNAKVVELAHQMDLAKSTVSERIQELAQENLIIYRKYYPIQFSKKGQRVADKLNYKHRLIEVFLHNILKISKDHIHKEADKLEHGFSNKAIDKLRKFLKDPKVCPHGQRIQK
jgi:DtxR family transcriptional regulator, Mn-dependent transcriptional regulator